MTPEEFSGGERYSNAYLRRLGFQIVSKNGERQDRHFGHIPGVLVGGVFDSRSALAAAGVHRPLQAGISGSGEEGADSIVLSGGYEDDEDYGVEIVYTGHGGNDPQTGRQVADQELTRGNRALAVSCRKGLPVRVTRGSESDSDFSPENGFRYDGPSTGPPTAI